MKHVASLEFTKMDQSDIEISESDPAFQLIASKIICSDLITMDLKAV